MTSKQAKLLQVKPKTQLSPMLEKCCLLVSANESYARTAQDVEVLTGISVSHSTQQRLVQRQEFPDVVVGEAIEEMSLDGGKVRLRTPKGQKCEWKDYKALAIHEQAVAAYFLNNDGLVDWVKQQPLSDIFSCLGDGHDGIWNLFAQMAPPDQRFEILDWYHLVEHLYGVGGSYRRLSKAESFLWKGDVDQAIALFDNSKHRRVNNFVTYLQKHRQRIPEYGFLQQLGISIGSGRVESTIKQISRRVKLSGAQWNSANVHKVLKHRCAYLNGFFSNNEYYCSSPN